MSVYGSSGSSDLGIRRSRILNQRFKVEVFMFDRKVHYLNDKGVLIKTDSFKEYFANGYSNMLVRDGKCYTDNGEPYPRDKAPDEWKKLYPAYFNDYKPSPEVVRKGRPKKEVLNVQESNNTEVR